VMLIFVTFSCGWDSRSRVLSSPFSFSSVKKGVTY
jgi:hypothetical protein